MSVTTEVEEDKMWSRIKFVAPHPISKTISEDQLGEWFEMSDTELTLDDIEFVTTQDTSLICIVQENPSEVNINNLQAVAEQLDGGRTEIKVKRIFEDEIQNVKSNLV